MEFGTFMMLVGGGLQILGGNQAAKNARKQAQAAQEAIDRAYYYDVEMWEMQKQQLVRDRNFKWMTVAYQAYNELKLAHHKDLSNIQQYNREVQIRNMEQASLDAQYEKSTDIFNLQIGFNAQAAEGARKDEVTKYQETLAEAAFDRNEAQLQSLETEGALRARGVEGRSVSKLNQAALSKYGANMAMLEESVSSANRNTRAALAEIDRDKAAADITALANKMLDPGILPEVVVPFATPLTEWQFPDFLQEFDFGVKPVKGRTMSPSTASAMVHAQTLTSIGRDAVAYGLKN